MWYTSTRAQAEWIVGRHFGVLTQAASDAAGRFMRPEDADTDALRKLMGTHGVAWLDARADDGSEAVMLDGLLTLEGSECLVYFPDDTYHFPYPDEPEWELVEEGEEDAWEWEGGAMGGRGYVHAERLAPCWFYEDIYYPT